MILKEKREISEIKEILAQKPSAVVTTHQNPDGDALGSMLALYHFLTKLGLSVTPISPNDYPEFLHWMPGNDKVLDSAKRQSKARRTVKEADVIFMVDFNEYKRSGDMEKLLSHSNAVTILIDHHPSPKIEPKYRFSYTEVSSTAELIYEFIDALGMKSMIDRDIAQCIYTAMMTDTGCFSFNSSRPRTFEIVANLLSFDIGKDEIYRKVYDNFSANRMRLLGYSLNDKMKVFPEYRCAFISISIEEQNRFSFETGDSEGFVNYPLSIGGVVFSALFIEKADKIKISFRSRGTFPVNLFSGKHFSGGGHLNAAGGESNLSLDQTIEKFVGLLPEYKHLLNA